MANSPSPSPTSQSAVVFVVLLLTFSACRVSSTAISQELEDMLQALRNHGYTLFTNAITTSDLQYQLLTNTAADDEAGPTSSFTLFAPKDELLYALDMATDAAVYVSTLRYHVVPNHRHTFANLKNLSSPFLDTLLPNYAVLIAKFRDGDVLFDKLTVGVMVDGVRVSNPDLFLGSRIAVHGIDGILLTGLNMNQDFDGKDNGSGIIPPVVPPAPGLDRNIPAGGTTAPTFQFDWNNVPPAPASTLSGNIPAGGTLTTPISQSDWNNVPATPASTFDQNIPTKGTTAPISQFDWNTVPGALESPERNIPAAATPNTLQDQIEKLKSGKKKRGKRHRKGRRRHRKHRALGDQ